MRPHISHDRVRGTPFQAHGRTYIPEAQVTMISGREATIGGNNMSIRGFFAQRVQPTALIESTPQGERRYRIDDPTMRKLIGMLLAAVVIPVVSSLLGRTLGGGYGK